MDLLVNYSEKTAAEPVVQSSPLDHRTAEKTHICKPTRWQSVKQKKNIPPTARTRPSNTGHGGKMTSIPQQKHPSMPDQCFHLSDQRSEGPLRSTMVLQSKKTECEEKLKKRTNSITSERTEPVCEIVGRSVLTGRLDVFTWQHWTFFPASVCCEHKSTPEPKTPPMNFRQIIEKNRVLTYWVACFVRSWCSQWTKISRNSFLFIIYL